MKWYSKEISEWLNPYDAYFSINLLVNTGDGVCEIGVYKGGYLITILKNISGLNALAIDPFPGLDFIKKNFFDNLKLNGLEQNVFLLPDYTSIRGRWFDLIHIDGEHSEIAALQDLHFAEKNLAEKGIIVVDDIWHTLFPGVISATMKFVHESRLVPFLSTQQKMYLCWEAEHEFHFSRAQKLLKNLDIPHSSGWLKGDANHKGIIAAYDQSNSIKGYRQLMVFHKSKDEQASILGLTKNRTSRLKRICHQLLPPLAISTFKKLASRSTQI